MTDRGAGDAPPAIVARGKIKVDARRAIRKLRDHLLVDLHLYSTEIARAAVAIGATKLDVYWDADDVILTFDGHPLAIDAVSRARDHVLTPESDVTDGDALRVLGIGISAALGLDPAFVDVYVTDAAASCARVRFEAKHLDEDAGAAAPPPTRVAVPSDPPGMPFPGMRVHVRKRVGLDILSRAVRRDLPREVALLVHAMRDSQLVLSINGQHPERPPGPVVLLRVDLDEPSATRASLEVLAPARDVGPRTHFLDLGVHLAEVAGVGLREPHDAELPLRIVLDARRLPTNASRSEVRADAEIVARIRSRVPAALDEALAALTKLASGQKLPHGKSASKMGHSVEVVDERPAMHATALGALAASAAIAMRMGKEVSAAEKALLHLPLLRNAIGAAMSLADVRGGSPQHPLLVYVADAPAAPELEPWLTEVVWLRGWPAERALAGLAQTSANERVALASEGRARQCRAFEHPPSRPILPTSSAYLLKEAFAVKEGPVAGLEGEVAVVKRERGYQRSSTVRLFVDERLLETMQLPGVALPVDMSLAWPTVFRPRLAYDGVERDERLSHAIVYALRVAAMAVGERLGSLDAELGRLAILAYASATQTLGDAAPARTALGKLAAQAVWPTSDGTFVTLEAIEAYASRTGALCVAPPNSGSAVDGRPVIVAEHGKALLGLLRAKACLVDYGVVLARGPQAAAETLAKEVRSCPAKVPITRKNAEGFVALGPNRRRIFHGGGPALRDEAFVYRNGPVLIVIDDRAAVPSANHRDLLWSSPDIADTAREEDALLELVVEQCERGELNPATVDDYLSPANGKLSARINARRRSDDLVWAAAMLKRLEELPAVFERNRLSQAKAAVLARPVLPAPEKSARSATVVTRSGTVTVTLTSAESDESVPGEVRFEGHLVGPMSAIELPLFVVADVVRDYFLKDWAALSSAGVTWARDTADQAALKLLEGLAQTGALASDPDALRLCESLLKEDRVAGSRVATVLREARWPTVQGTTTTLGDGGSISFGIDAFAPYRTAAEASPYDAPSLHLPRGPLGDARRSVLTRAGFTLRDVSEATARLQALRSKGEKSPPPRLTGAAPHPRLRESLAKLGATRAEGELELVDGASSIERVDARGIAEPVALSLVIPVRAIFRADDATREQLEAELAGAAVRHLRALGDSLDGLPNFVRDRLRTVVCESVRLGLAAEGDDTFTVFAEKTGAFWSLAQLVELGTIRRTRDAGTWSTPNPNAPIFCMSNVEAHSLRAVLKTEDVTEELREAQLGAERRAAPQLERIELSPESRAQCIYTFTVDEDGMRGEIGLLRPQHSGALRGIALHTTKRRLTTFEDGGAWPTIAALDIDGIETTRAFDGLASKAEVARIQRRVRAVLAGRVVDILPAPKDALGVVRLPVPFLARSDASSSTELPVPCLGLFWLTPEWPEAPCVHVEGFDFADPLRVPRLPPSTGAHHRVMPVAGRVWICADSKRADAALSVACRFVLDRLAPHLASASGAPRGMAQSERDAYTWDLRLLGALTDLDAVQELASDRPDSALMRVAARRAPHLIDAATGDKPAAKAAAAATRVEAPLPSFEPEPAVAVVPPPLGNPQEEAPLSEPEAPPGETFLRGLVRWVVELVTPAPEKLSQSALTQALQNALAAMKLTGDPVAAVVESSRGRPVRYEARTKRVIVNAAHASVVALEAHPSRVLFLLAAAVSEINRELVPVTDAEELAVIVDLLREG